MRTEVFSEDGVVGFADFTSLVMCAGMVNMSTFGEEDREETYDEFEILGERKTNNSEHSFKGVIRVINPISTHADPRASSSSATKKEAR